MKSKRSLTLTVCVLLAATAVCIGAYGQSLPDKSATQKSGISIKANEPDASANQPPAITTQNLQEFFAGLVPYALKRDDIAGASISIVSNGKLIFANGYGYSNLKTHAPVIPDKTLFRIGSTSKLLTWTAVMQLVQAGKIDLNRDVNDYLDFKIPPKFGAPITMRDLMTHTPGFIEVGRDLFAPSQKQLLPLQRYLMENIPERIYPPGKIAAYSNYGAALAGYIVQRVSGEPFNQYVQEHIFKPLSMTHSTFAQPLPAALQPDMSNGYLHSEQDQPQPFEFITPAPAGAMSTTATDMAHFMIAQLNQGQYQDASILSPAITSMMHSVHYRAAPGINGMDLGFYQQNRNGHQIIGHGGDTYQFHSYLYLITDANVGFFIVFNSAGTHFSAANVREEIFRQFLNRFFPYSVPNETTVAYAERDAQRVAGWYIPSRRPDLGLQYLSQIQIEALPNGQIAFESPISGTQRFREVGPLSYRKVNGQMRLKFVTGPSGAIRYGAVDSAPFEVIQPVHGLKQLGLVTPFVSGASLVFVITLFIWFGGWAIRKRYKQPLALTRNQQRLRLASRVGVKLQIALLLGWLLMAAWIGQPQHIVLFESDGASKLIALYVLGFAAVIGGMAIVAEAVWRVVKGPGKWLCRSGEFLLGLSALYSVWFILAFGLVRFTTRF